MIKVDQHRNNKMFHNHAFEMLSVVNLHLRDQQSTAKEGYSQALPASAQQWDKC